MTRRPFRIRGLAALLLVLAAAPLAPLLAQSAQVLFEQGQALELKGKAAEAIAAYTKAIAAEPRFSEAYRRRAITLVSTGNRQGAIADFTRAIDADPKNARAYNGRASSRMNLKDYVGAMKDLDSAIVLDPNYSNAWSNRGRTKADGLGDLTGGLADVNRSIELDPKNRLSYWVRADLKSRLKDTAGAIADFTTVIDLDARDPAPLVLRGRLLAGSGDPKGAERDFKGALVINPSLAEAKEGLARIGSGQAVATWDASDEEARRRAQPRPPAPAPTPAPAVAAAPAAAPAAPRAAPAAAPSEGRVMVSTLPPELAAAVEKVTTASPSAGPDVPWRAPSGRPVALASTTAPSTMPPALDINNLTIEQFNGAVSTAMEQMRLLQGQLSPEDTKRFEKKWAPLFDAPTAEVIDYFNKLNPLLAEFISVRTQIELGAEEYRAGIVEAGIAATNEDEEGTRLALDVAAQQKSAIEAQQARLSELLTKIQALGNPPDPVESKRRARAKHEQAMKIFSDAPVYADFLGVWIGEMLPLRPDPYPAVSQTSDLDPGALILGFFEGTYQPGLHADQKLAPGAKWSWDRPDLVVHNPQTGAITFLSGFGWAFSPTNYAKLAMKRLGVMWTDGNFTAGNWGSPPIFHFFDPKEAYLDHLEVRGDEMTGVVQGMRGGGLYRMSLHRVQSEPAPDPHGFDPEAIAGRTREIDEANARLNAPGDSPEQRSLALDKRNGLLWRFYPFQEYSRHKRVLVHLLLNWKPKNARDLDDPGAALEPAYSALYNAVSAANAEAAVPARSTVAAPAPAPPAPPAQPAEPTMSPEMRAEEVADAKLRILSLEKDIEFYGKQVSTLKTPQLEYATLNLKSKQADILQERDRISYLQTGEYVHTRTPLDEWNFNRGVASAEKDALDAHVSKQGAAAAYKLVEMADPAQKAELRAFLNRQLTPQVLGSNDAKKIRQVVEAVANQAIGFQQKQGAKAEEDATDAEERVYWTKTAVTALGVAVGGVGAGALMEAGVTGFALHAGSMGIGALYGGATGYIEGGPVQAVEQAAASTGLVAFGIIEGMKGYHEPIIDPVTGQPTGEIGGWAGAADKGGTAMVTGWLIGKGVQVVAGYATPAIENGLNRMRRGIGGGAPRVPTNAEVAAVNKSGRDVVNRYADLRKKLTAATAANAPKEEIAAINKSLETVGAEVDANYASKSLLQKMQKTGTDADKYLAKDFRVRQKMLNKKVDQQFDLDRTNGKGGTEGIHYEELTPTGWTKRPLTFRDIRNASSGRKLNMDRDKALNEHPLFARGSDGKMQPVRENWVLHPDGTPKTPKFRLVDGSGKSISMAKANRQLQATFNGSYHSVTGQRPIAASQTLTSSANTEAYRDLAWIDDLSDANNIRVLDATGARSAREVATFKGYHSGDPVLAPLLKEREVARASSKEIRLRLLNIIRNMKNVSPAAKEQSLQHWQKMQDALDGYVDNPVGGAEKLRSLTGKSLAETMADIGYAIEAGVRFGKF